MNVTIPRPRAVLFDLFDTLVPAIAPGQAFPPTWEDLGIPIDAYQKRWFQNHDGRATGRIKDPVEVIRIVAHDIDPSISMAAIERAVERRVRSFESVLTRVDAATVAALESLRGWGIKVALVSNACVGEIDAWPRSPFAPHFDAAVFSCEVGMVKPDPGIYEAALARVGVEADDAIFVGDGGSEEHRGARSLGMRTALITGLVHARWAHAMEERRKHVDWEFEHVPAFVAALAP
jgi:putative hydrolase of the HAD superfamily